MENVTALAWRPLFRDWMAGTRRSTTSRLDMPRLRVLITVKAYPTPSKTYDDLVCTAGIAEGGQWIRIYPVPFRALLTDDYFRKYQWIELDLVRRHDRDFRPESFSPADGDLRDITKGDWVDTKNGWLHS